MSTCARATSAPTPAWRAAALLAAGLSLAAQGQSPPIPATEHAEAARRAHAARDYPAMERHWRAFLEKRPGQPTGLYNLAAAQALQNQGDAALAPLQRLARMGLRYDLSQDLDFRSLRASPAYAKLAAALLGNGLPQGAAQTAFRLPRLRYFPEGLAHDPDTGRFFAGSVRERLVSEIGRDLAVRDFGDSGHDGLWSVLGLQVDAPRRALWVTTAALPQMAGYAPELDGKSALLHYDADTRALRERYDLPADGQAHVLGDVLVTPKGRVFASDSRAGKVWQLERRHGSLVALPDGHLSSPQGLALSQDRGRLYVADYAQGIVIYDLGRQAWRPVAAAPDVCLYGIDGLYAYGRDLIAVQNGVQPQRVLRIALDARGERAISARVLASGLREFGEPTLGVVVDQSFYLVANSPWGKVGKDHQLPPDVDLEAPRIMRIALE